jgi:hypothetical protein
MKDRNFHLIMLLIIFVSFNTFSEPGFNGSTPGCSGSGCHSFQDNMVTVVPLSNLQVQITITGNSGNIAGELVNSSGTVVASINSTSNNPFTLTAPTEGYYLINAGYKNPSRRWDSTHVNLQLSQPPAPPSNLAAQLIPSPLSVQLVWTDNSNNENGFIIERESQGTDAFTVIDTVSANSNSFLDNTVTYLTYVYRITAFNAFGQSAYSNVAQIIVPVELTSFSASIQDAGVLLKWTTATEINNKGFEILRAVYPIGSDMQNDNWVSIGFVEGRGTTTEITNYNFYNDLTGLNAAATLKYKLKQIDFSGAFTYSDIVEVDYTPVNYQLAQNYPNPFNPSTSISFTLPVSAFVSLKIYNILGNEVTTLVNQLVQAGKHEVKFDATGLPSGVYLYTLRAGDPATGSGQAFIETKKMLLMK